MCYLHFLNKINRKTMINYKKLTIYKKRMIKQFNKIYYKKKKKVTLLLGAPNIIDT